MYMLIINDDRYVAFAKFKWSLHITRIDVRYEDAIYIAQRLDIYSTASKNNTEHVLSSEKVTM